MEARGVPGLDPVAKKLRMAKFIATNSMVKAGKSLSPVFGYGGSMGGGIMEVGDISMVGWFPVPLPGVLCVVFVYLGFYVKHTHTQLANYTMI